MSLLTSKVKSHKIPKSNMDDKEIYSKLRKVSIRRIKYLGGESIIVPKKNFKNYKRFFSEVTDILNNNKNYRTKKSFKHLHAIEGKRYVEIHFDHGNPKSNLLAKTTHLFRDVIPYFSHNLLRSNKLYFLDQIEKEEVKFDKSRT